MHYTWLQAQRSTGRNVQFITSRHNPTGAWQFAWEYDLKRDLVEINRKAPQWSHNTVWNKRYMEPRPGFAYHNCGELRVSYHTETSLLWSERQWYPPGCHGLTAVPAATLPESAFPRGTRNLSGPNGPTTNWIASAKSCRRVGTKPLWEQSSRNPGTDAGRKTSPHQKDGGEMLIAIVLDRPLEEAKSIGGRSWCLHPSDHQDHTRQTEPPSYCTNDQPRGKRWPTTLGESS